MKKLSLSWQLSHSSCPVRSPASGPTRNAKKYAKPSAITGDRSAIRHMEAANYGNLEQCVLTTIEGTYPDYNKYDQLTAKRIRSTPRWSPASVSRSAIISRIAVAVSGGRVATGRYPARRRDRRTDPGLLYLPGRKGERTVRDAAAGLPSLWFVAAGVPTELGRRDATVRRFGGGSGGRFDGRETGRSGKEIAVWRKG